ncbi:hypothetical protein ACFYRY_13295 [Streptomyces sp. NPDC005263]|uniref:hypothetical protein n=1 Tax=Streptomyces sp. NPDC005263 TaxID=3364711 RepID=UPI0036966287
MFIRRVSAIAAAAAGLAALLVPAADANAAEASSQGSATARSAQAADGYLHVWTDPHGGGTPCFWSVNADDWGPCTNKASDIWNNGYEARNDAVDLYWGAGATGAHACISRGDSWPDLTTDQYRFTYDSGKKGFGQSVNDNIHSHRWVDFCSQG